MSEVRIEKVENGYIVRCINEHDDETFVYNNFQDAVEFVAGVMKEKLK